MRLLRVAIGLLMLASGIALFSHLSVPQDFVAAFRPYMISEEISYKHTEDVIAGKNRYVQVNMIEVKGPTLKDAQKLGSSIFYGRPQLIAYHTPLPPGWPMIPKGKPEPMAGKIWVDTDLKWNEILWIRLTHLGSNPFPDRL